MSRPQQTKKEAANEKAGKDAKSLRQNQTFCICGKVRENCSNFRAYGYDCHGLRSDNKGSFLQAPFGYSNYSQFKTGPSFNTDSDDDSDSDY